MGKLLMSVCEVEGQGRGLGYVMCLHVRSERLAGDTSVGDRKM